MEKTVDVLRSILSDGLLPQADILARAILPAEQTISLSHQYIYARCYAQIFGVDESESNNICYLFGEYGEWWPYFMNETRNIVRRSIGNLLWLPRIRKNLRTKVHL